AAFRDGNVTPNPGPALDSITSLPRVDATCFAILAGTLSPTLFPYTTLFRSPHPARTSVRNRRRSRSRRRAGPSGPRPRSSAAPRSEEHTSELQSRGQLVCRLLLEKNKNQTVFDGTSTPIAPPLQRIYIVPSR